MPEKLSPHSSPTEKTLGLFSLLLFTGKRYTLSQLATKLGCSKQSVMRMVDQIERSHAAGIETGIDHEKRRWYRIRAPRSRPNVALPPESIQYLVLCKELVWHLLPGSMRQEIDSTLNKTTVLLHDPEERPRALAHVMDVSVKGAIDYTPRHRDIGALLRCIGEELSCRLLYKSARSQEPREHLFAPVRLMSYREALYAMGAIMDRDNPSRVKHTAPLAVHRMSEVMPLDIPRPEIVCEEECEGFGFVRGKLFRVKAKFEPDVAHYVRERVWSNDQEITEYKNGRLLLEFTARSELEVVSWILGFGCKARILAPRELRIRVKEEIRTMLSLYRP